MIVCLKDVVIHVTAYLDPIKGLLCDLEESDEQVHVSCNLIVLLCVYVLKVMLSKCVLAIILPR